MAETLEQMIKFKQNNWILAVAAIKYTCAILHVSGWLFIFRKYLGQNMANKLTFEKRFGKKEKKKNYKHLIVLEKIFILCERAFLKLAKDLFLLLKQNAYYYCIIYLFLILTYQYFFKVVHKIDHEALRTFNWIITLLMSSVFKVTTNNWSTKIGWKSFWKVVFALLFNPITKQYVNGSNGTHTHTHYKIIIDVKENLLSSFSVYEN